MNKNIPIDDSFSTYEIPKRFIPKIGDYINEYQITGELGEGTFGKVYKVVNKAGDIYALKMIKLWEIAYERERKTLLSRFVREFEISNFKSEFTAQSFDYGKIEGNPYIILEYCGGGTLSNLIGKSHDLTTINNIAYRILKGLQEIHNRGFFHRDIKPNNILIDDFGRVKLTDFGIAGHKNSRMTETNIFGKVEQIFGTWAYIAPEQSNNKIAFKSLNATTDIYSFGIMMYELFAGSYPYPPYKIFASEIEDESEKERQENQNLLEYLDNARKGNHEGLRINSHKIPGNWAKIIQGCIEVDYQKKRIQTVGEIINMLGYKSIDVVYAKYDSMKNELALQVTYGEELNKTYNISALLAKKGNTGIVRIGRKDPSVSNDVEIVEIQSTYISRRHATIEKWANPKKWIIRDGQWYENSWKTSVNKLYVNSKEVNATGTEINPGDIITMGDTILRIIVL